MMEHYEGKTAVITGAASGMGLLASRNLCEAGATVVLCDVNEEGLAKAAEEINARGRGRAIACVCNVRVYADAEKAASLALAETGRIDLLVNFAGGWEPRMLGSIRPFYEQPLEVIDWGLEVNMRGPVYMTRACLPAMIKAKSGVVCCIGSVSGRYGSVEGPMYGASKAGLSEFVKSIALAGAPHGVRAVCVAPGPVLTRPGMAAMATPLNRAAAPQEVVDFIFYLCSDRAAYVTGSTHLIDGGKLAMEPR